MYKIVFEYTIRYMAILLYYTCTVLNGSLCSISVVRSEIPAVVCYCIVLLYSSVGGWLTPHCTPQVRAQARVQAWVATRGRRPRTTSGCNRSAPCRSLLLAHILTHSSTVQQHPAHATARSDSGGIARNQQAARIRAARSQQHPQP